MSAKYGHGIEDVREWILSKLPLGPAYYPKVCIQLFFAVLFILMLNASIRLQITQKLLHFLFEFNKMWVGI